MVSSSLLLELRYSSRFGKEFPNFTSCFPSHYTTKCPKCPKCSKCFDNASPPRKACKMDGDEDFKLIQDGISVSLVEMTRTAGLIANEDLAFYRSSNSKVTTSLQEQSHRLLAVARQLMECAVLRTQLTAPALRNAEAVEDNWRGIVDVVDGLLENADAALDEQSGVIKKPQLVDEIPVIRTTTFSSLSIRSQKLAKPQLLFDVPPDNRIDRVFKPLLKSKPHAKVPLEESIRAEKGNSKEYDDTRESRSLLTDVDMGIHTRPKLGHISILHLSTTWQSRFHLRHSRPPRRSSWIPSKVCRTCFENSKVHEKLPSISNITTFIPTLAWSLSCRLALEKRTGWWIRFSRGDMNYRCSTKYLQILPSSRYDSIPI